MPPPTLKNRVTLAKVAKAAKVSIGTASNAINGNSYTAPATAAKVLKVAKELGYSPDATISVAMSKIRHGRFRGHEEVLAYVTAHRDKDAWRRSYEKQSYWEGAVERARELGYRLVEYWLGERGISEARHSRILFSRGIRGLILAPHPHPDAHLKLDWTKFAAVAISRSIKEPVVHRVLDDHAAMMRIAMKHLLDHGYRRIGFAMNQNRVERTDELWTGAYLAHQRLLEPEHRIPLCIPEAQRQDAPCGPALLDWFNTHRPDAILGIDPVDIEYLERHDLRCPRDYGYAYIYSANPKDSRFAGVIRNARQVGRTAVSQIAGMLKNNEIGLPKYPHLTLLEGYWKDGPSVRRQKTGSRRLSTLL